jgi:hypothetical protein
VPIVKALRGFTSAELKLLEELRFLLLAGNAWR